MQKEQWLVEAAHEVEIPRHDLEDKKPTIICDDKFGFEEFEEQFSFALAQSVFTHLPLQDISACLISMAKVLKKRGKFYASFFEGSRNKQNVVQLEGEVVSYPDRDPYHYEFEQIVEVAGECGLETKYIGDWGHLASKMMEFRLVK